MLLTTYVVIVNLEILKSWINSSSNKYQVLKSWNLEIIQDQTSRCWHLEILNSWNSSSLNLVGPHQLQMWWNCRWQWNVAIFIALVTRLRLLHKKCQSLSQNFRSKLTQSIDFKAVQNIRRLVNPWSHL